jgi:hypothetical protein
VRRPRRPALPRRHELRPVAARAHGRAAELVEQRPVLRRFDDREHPDLLVTVDEPRGHARRLEGRRSVIDMRTADEHALPAEQPSAQLLLQPLPLAPRPDGEPNEPLVVVTVPKNTRAPRGLTRARSTDLEQPAINSAPPERIRRRQANDASTDYGYLGTRNSHARTVRLTAGPAVQTAARVKVRCVTPLGEEVASIS